MKKQLFLSAACVTLILAASGSSLWAQDSSQVAYASEAEGKAAKTPPKKAPKVWTEDNLGSVRTASDNYLDQKAAAEAAAAAKTAVKQEQTATPKPTVGGKAALANPKSSADADKMIAWEERDLDAQQEFVNKLRTDLQTASPEEKERIQKQIDKRLQIIEEVKQERNSLLSQKKAMEKKAAAGEDANPDANPDATAGAAPSEQ
jgi:hypothetical protein